MKDKLRRTSTQSAEGRDIHCQDSCKHISSHAQRTATPEESVQVHRARLKSVSLLCSVWAGRSLKPSLSPRRSLRTGWLLTGFTAYLQ